jgi:predicted kinase
MALPLVVGPEVVVMVGLQGCGKSTWVKQHLAGSHVVVSKDFWPNSGHKETRQRRAIAQALAAGLDIVVDNTNPSLIERASIIDMARQYGASVRAVYVDTPLAACLARNATRSGRASVPTVGILSTRRRLVPPRLDEGFDQVETVHPALQSR